MKLRTSFFDKATFKKDITRYWPIWVLYTVLLLMLMLPTVTGSSWGSFGVWLNPSLEAWIIGNFLYAALVSQLLFGDLFNARMCYALHAMPATRTARFISHISAGMLFALVPDLICAVLMIPALESQLWFTPLIWLALMMLEYLCFFGIGVLSAVCTGKRLAAVAVYTILNFFSLVIYYFASTVIVPMMYGVVLYADPFLPFSPVATLSTYNDYIRISGDFYDSPHHFKGLGEASAYLCIAGAVGAVLLAVSWLLYRRRKLESAGAFITSKWLSPVFLTLYTLCAGAFLPIFSSIFVTNSNAYTIPLIVGLIAGFFTGKMLLERTIKIFRKSTFIQFAAVVLIAAAGLWCVKADVFGIVSFVPEKDDIETVTYTLNYDRYDGKWDEEDVQALLAVHQWAVDHPCDKNCGETHKTLKITYELKDGRTVIRTYYICNGSIGEGLLSFLPKSNRIY